jgi:hypothetical protein
MLQEVERAIDIFEQKTHKWATGLFLFDNTPSHQKRADDALSARKMPKRPSLTRMAPECIMAPFQMVPASRSITPKIIRQCLAGSKVWRKLSRNAISGQQLGLMLNVTASNASLGALIAVVAGFFSYSLTVLRKNHGLKST